MVIEESIGVKNKMHTAMKPTRTASMIAFAKLLVLSTVSYGQTFNVPQNYPNISSAINSAHDGDVITVSPGTYHENIVIQKNITIRSQSNSSDTIIMGNTDGSVVSFVGVRFNGNIAPSISGFTISNGKSGEGSGGGVTVYKSDAVIEQNHITNNYSSFDAGGILVNMNSNATIRNNIIDSNKSTRYGGGIYIVNNSNPLVYNNLISNNQTSGLSTTMSGAGGGGIYIDANSSPQIVKNTISFNHADHSGGGISLRVNVNAIIEDNTINGNDSAYGGGVHIETEGGSPTIRNNTISENLANESNLFPGSGFGGGISIYNQSKPQIIKNIISNNSATQGGGGIVSSEGASSTIASNKIYSNKVPMSNTGYKTGGGIYIANSTATIFNNVISANEASLGGGIGLLDNANAVIANNTIVKNLVQLNRPVVSAGGGISVMRVAASAIIANNIISQNAEYQVFEEYKKSRIINNLINNDEKGLYFNWDIHSLSSIDNLNNNPNANALSNISGNEGFNNPQAQDYSIGRSSSAIDQGYTPPISQYDINYSLRNLGTNPDIGAYEYTTETRKTKPVYRFWSDTKQHHFYTISSDEKNLVLNNYKRGEWGYEGEAFRAYDLVDCGNLYQVYRFWSNQKQGHFYTISSDEKNYVINSYPSDVWNYESPAFCADTASVSYNTPLYRFWSDTKQGHFYTSDGSEKNYIQNNYPSNIWRYEAIAYYVYPTL